MKPFFKTKVGNLLKEIGLGFIQAPLQPIKGMIGGAIIGVKDIAGKNMNSMEGGQGKLNIPHLIGVAVFIVLVGLLLAGVIDKETFEYLHEFFIKKVN